MKLLLSILISATLVSCERQVGSNNSQYTGEYYKDERTKTLVSTNGEYLSFTVTLVGTIVNKMIFDSVSVDANGNAYVNQVYYDNGAHRCVGTGKFTGRSLEYTFILDGSGTLKFSGVK